MKPFWRSGGHSTAGEPTSASDALASAESADQQGGTVAGERGTVSVDRTRSLQSRVSNGLAIGLMSALALGLIGWYYSQILARHARAEEEAQSAAQVKTRGEMSLPPLGRIDPPMVERVLGPPPTPPEFSRRTDRFDADYENSTAALADHQADHGRDSPQLEDADLKRRLSGEALIAVRMSAAGTPDRTTGDAPGTAGVGGAALTADGSVGRASASDIGRPSEARQATTATGDGASDLAKLLQPEVTPVVRASVLPTQRLLLGRGSFLDCTLETAIDSSLPGMTTCITATDTFGLDGTVVLLPRGSKLTGETRGQVRQGVARVFVLWTEARTPDGVDIPLASPGTDELGRAGLAGEVNRHFWERFGAAILISVIDGAVQSAVQSARDDGSTVIVNSSGSSEIMTEVLRSTLQIRPTVRKRNGDRISVLVARDLDFRSVYELRPVAHR